MWWTYYVLKRSRNKYIYVLVLTHTVGKFDKTEWRKGFQSFVIGKAIHKFITIHYFLRDWIYLEKRKQICSFVNFIKKEHTVNCIVVVVLVIIYYYIYTIALVLLCSVTTLLFFIFNGNQPNEFCKCNMYFERIARKILIIIILATNGQFKFWTSEIHS